VTREEWTRHLLAEVEALWTHMDEVEPLSARQASNVATTSARWLAERQLRDVGDLITHAVAVLTFARENALAHEEKRKAEAS
jgi:hypothetical protein